MNMIWCWVSLLAECWVYDISDIRKIGNPEIRKILEEMKSLHSLNSAIKELVSLYFNFDSEETSPISDKKDTDDATWCNRKDIRCFHLETTRANGFLKAMTAKVEPKLPLCWQCWRPSCFRRFMGRQWLVRMILGPIFLPVSDEIRYSPFQGILEVLHLIHLYIHWPMSRCGMSILVCCEGVIDDFDSKS